MVGEQDHTYTLVSVCVEHVCSYVHHQVCNCKISLLALLCWFISLFRGVLSLELPKGLGYFLLSSAMASGRSVQMVTLEGEVEGEVEISSLCGGMQRYCLQHCKDDDHELVSNPRFECLENHIH